MQIGADMEWFYEALDDFARGLYPSQDFATMVQKRILSERSEVERREKNLAIALDTAARSMKREREEMEVEITALEQKLLASEVRGGELREVLEYVYHAIRSHSSVVVSCRGAVGTMNEHEHHLQRGIDEIRKVLAKGTAHYSSQVEAIGKMVEALEYISKYDLYKHGLKDGQLNIEHHINVMASDALTTWNSIKGETEGA